MYRAICYSDVFDFPITLDEMRKFSIKVGAPVSEKIIEKRVRHIHGYFCLRGREKLVTKRLRNEVFYQDKLRRTSFVCRICAYIPTVSAVFITGGLAVGNVRFEDDIDFLIVTKPGWLWTSRFLLVMIAKLLRMYTHKRLYRGDATSADANTWCFNLWLSEYGLTVPKDKRNLYTAHEVLQARPLLDKHHVSDRFLSENAWVEQFIDCRIAKKTTQTQSFHILFIEKCFHWIQHIGKSKKLSYHVATFFPVSTADQVIREYEKRL